MLRLTADAWMWKWREELLRLSWRKLQRVVKLIIVECIKSNFLQHASQLQHCFNGSQKNFPFKLQKSRCRLFSAYHLRISSHMYNLFYGFCSRQQWIIFSCTFKRVMSFQIPLAVMCVQQIVHVSHCNDGTNWIQLYLFELESCSTTWKACTCFQVA